MNKFNKKGSALIFVIVGITMAAALGVGMFYMTTTSTIGQVSGSGMDRAYYLAMAGKYYALANWQPNNGEYIISNTERFDIDINNEKVTGIVNKNTPFEAKKEIEINSFGSSPVKRHFKDSFDDAGLPNWKTGVGPGGDEVGSHGVSGDNALDVISSAAAFGSGSWSFLQLKSGSGGGIDITPSWENAGYCLSYDLQVKINNNQPNYMAGLNFKITGSGDGRKFYGVSYLRARNWWFGGSADGITSDLKPPAIWPGTGSFPYYYSQPAIILWKKDDSGFAWLAYKVLTDTDFVVDSSGNLVDWSNLQVRLIEAYPLDFTNGVSSLLLSGAIITGETSGAKARISGSPIMTSATDGTLTLANICIPCSPATCPAFQNGENLLVNKTVCGQASGILGAKTNFIRVYYSDEGSHGANINPTDNTRGSNPRDAAIHWPVENMSNWELENDYMTLLTWDGINAIVNPPEILTEQIKVDNIPTFAQFDTIIKDGSLLTPTPPDCTTILPIDYSGIALHATGTSADSTYLDDFAVQY
ncbi:MAG: hypothetical protein ABIK92_02890 [Pseudomonadota bacterium]